MSRAKKAEKAASKATALLEKAGQLQEKAESRVDPAGPAPRFGEHTDAVVGQLEEGDALPRQLR